MSRSVRFDFPLLQREFGRHGLNAAGDSTLGALPLLDTFELYRYSYSIVLALHTCAHTKLRHRALGKPSCRLADLYRARFGAPHAAAHDARADAAALARLFFANDNRPTPDPAPNPECTAPRLQETNGTGDQSVACGWDGPRGKFVCELSAEAAEAAAAKVPVISEDGLCRVSATITVLPSSSERLRQLVRFQGCRGKNGPVSFRQMGVNAAGRAVVLCVADEVKVDRTCYRDASLGHRDGAGACSSRRHADPKPGPCCSSRRTDGHVCGAIVTAQSGKEDRKSVV